MPFSALDATHSSSRRLGARMVSAVLVWSLLSAFLVTLVQLYLYYQTAVQRANQRLVEVEQVFVPMLAEALWTIDRTRIEAQLQSIFAIPEVGSVTLIEELNTQRHLQKPDADGVLSERKYPIIFHDTDSQSSHQVGELSVQISNGSVSRRLWSYATAVATSTLSALMLGSLLLWWLYHRWINRHLSQVARYAASLDLNAQEQQLHLERPEQKNPDELDIVVHAINQMQQRIRHEFEEREKVEQELLQHRDHLEQLVNERTRLLQQKTEQLQHQSEELAEQNSELNAYAHTVAHDLKHPLTSLIGLSTLLSQPQLEIHLEQQRQFLGQIKQSALKMNGIINALLQLASIRSEQQVELEPVDMQHYANEAIVRLQLFAREQQASIQITTPLPVCLGHGQWLEEVWVNYISNAIKYAGPQARIELGATPLDGQKIRYWVRDYGPGVPAHKQHELFTEFSQLQAYQSDSHGLGLSIVKRIVQKLRGEVGYQQAEDGGSLFWFILSQGPSQPH